MLPLGSLRLEGTTSSYHASSRRRRRVTGIFLVIGLTIYNSFSSAVWTLRAFVVMSNDWTIPFATNITSTPEPRASIPPNEHNETQSALASKSSASAAITQNVSVVRNDSSSVASPQAIEKEKKDIYIIVPYRNRTAHYDSFGKHFQSLRHRPVVSVCCYVH